MELDPRTLSFALLLTFFIQAIAFFMVTLVIRKYKGSDLWALGGLFIALGFGSIYLRSFNTSYDGLLIMASNFFQIGGIALFYVGSKQFFGFMHKNDRLIIGYILYLLIIGYFTFIDYDLKVRIIVFSAFMIFLSLHIAWIFINYSKSSYQKSSWFVAFVFIVNSIFFICRIFYYLNNENPTSFFKMDAMQSATLILSICQGLLWTFGIIIVVNQRLNAELTETKNLFELIFNTIPDGIVISDKNTYQYINANPSFSRLSGYTKEEALQNPDFSKQIWANQENHIRLRDDLETNGFYNNQEFVLRHKNGTEKISLLSSTQIRIKDRDCVLTIGRDITDLKQNEQELAKKTQELELMIAEKDKFFSILAHDLRGPVASAMNLTELMTDKSYDFSKEELLHLAESLNKSAKSTNELLENLLAWTGIQRGLKAFTPKQITFSDLMAPFLANLMDTARNKQISLRNDIPDNTQIIADSYMAQTVFRNLINNAIKFTREGGNIQLSFHINDKGQTFFSVADSGIGMNKDTLDTLFQLDFKNNRSGTNGEPSSGLGLLLCKEFVEKHGGNIWAKSEVGKGSTFSFTLGTE